MRLVNVYDEPDADQVLYELLAERPLGSWISHERLPTFREHQAFVQSHPFLLWLLIWEQEYIGAIEANDRNEMGISILKRYQGKGYGRRALTMFMDQYQPLPTVPAIRNGRWLANLAVGNEGSEAFFRKMGFVPIQTTMVLRND